jgi:hypothetical protein
MAINRSPVVDTFTQLRLTLARLLGISPDAIDRDTLLEDLIPIESRREVWEELQKHGFHLPNLQLPTRDGVAKFVMECKTAISIALGMQSWLGLFSFFPLAWLLSTVTRHLAIMFPYREDTTLGDVAFYLTPFNQPTTEGHRFTREEIGRAVRIILADRLAVDISELTDDRPLFELMDC